MMLCIWSQQGNSYVSTNICLEVSKVGHFLTYVNKYSKVKIFRLKKVFAQEACLAQILAGKMLQSHCDKMYSGLGLI